MRARVLLVAAAIVLTLVLLSHPGQVAIKTALLLPAVFPAAPINPLAVTSAPPVRTEHAFDYRAGHVEADVYHPRSTGPHGGAILLLGARPVPRRDPLLVGFADALARTGVVVLVPESSSLLAGSIVPEEIEALERSYRLLLDQPDVDPARTGFIGFSVGGGLSLVAAARPELRGRVAFVNSLGGYFDAVELLVEVASRSVDLDGHTIPWQPSPLTLAVLATQVIDTHPDPGDRERLRRVYLEHASPDEVDAAALSPAGRAAAELLAGTTRERAQAIVAQLPADTLERLAAISPSRHLDGLRARLYLMHDTGDSYIPYSQSRDLVRAAPAGLIQRSTELSIFAHVVPDRPMPWQTFLPDLWALYWHLDAVLLELV